MKSSLKLNLKLKLMLIAGLVVGSLNAASEQHCIQQISTATRSVMVRKQGCISEDLKKLVNIGAVANPQALIRNLCEKDKDVLIEGLMEVFLDENNSDNLLTHIQVFRYLLTDNSGNISRKYVDFIRDFEQFEKNNSNSVRTLITQIDKLKTRFPAEVRKNVEAFVKTRSVSTIYKALARRMGR